MWTSVASFACLERASLSLHYKKACETPPRRTACPQIRLLSLLCTLRPPLRFVISAYTPTRHFAPQRALTPVKLLQRPRASPTSL
jgi:hypothetical protein